MSRIQITLQKNQDGFLWCLSSMGHANRQDGESLPCGIVSSALRSFGRLVSEREDLQVRAQLSRPGHFELQVVRMPREALEWYRGVGDLLERTLFDVQTDFPDLIEIELQIKEQEI